MFFILSQALAFICYLSWSSLVQVHATPVEKNQLQNDFSPEFAALKHAVVYDWGYSKEFAEAVVVNLKRAINEELAMQKRLGIVVSDQLRQNQPDYYYDDETTTPPGPTTPGASTADVVRGIAGIVASLGTLNIGNFWQSFVNFFPPGQREGAQALVDGAFGRRPGRWPTLPTTPSTTTKITTSTKDEDYLESSETTTPATTVSIIVASGTTQSPSTVAGGPATIDATQAPATVAAATRAPTTRYTVRRRQSGILPGNIEFRNVEEKVTQKVVMTDAPLTTTAHLDLIYNNTNHTM